MDDIADGPTLKKQRLSEVRPDNLAQWLGMQIQPVCSESQVDAVRKRLSSLTKEELRKALPNALDYAINNDIEDANQ